MTRGKFLTLEGIDGVGKSSHLAFIVETLSAHGHEVVATREPGGTPLGETLRDIVLNQTMHPDTESLLVFASRREHIAQVIGPALTRGAWVLSDRFTDSSFAYQCGGRLLSQTRMRVLEDWVHADLQPDLTFLFDAPIELARERLLRGTTTLDKFEREQSTFFSNVREAYLARAKAFPKRIRIINTARSLGEIQAELAQSLTEMLVAQDARHD